VTKQCYASDIMSEKINYLTSDDRNVGADPHIDSVVGRLITHIKRRTRIWAKLVREHVGKADRAPKSAHDRCPALSPISGRNILECVRPRER
jgi:hypothetical protein